MLRQLYININAFLLYAFMVAVNWTLRIRMAGDKSITDNVLFAIWHQCSFVLSYSNPFEKMAVLTATRTRGEIFTRAVARFGDRTIQTSYDEEPKQAAKAAISVLASLKEGYNVVVALDGPKGPIFDIKPGIFLLSKKSGKKIVPIGIAYSRKIGLPRWDRYIIPLPFSRVAVYLDSSFVDDGTPENLKKAMLSAQKKAAALLAAPAGKS